MVTSSILRFCGRLCLIAGGFLAFLSLVAAFFVGPSFWMELAEPFFWEIDTLGPASMSIMSMMWGSPFAPSGNAVLVGVLLLGLGVLGWAVFASLARLSEDIARGRDRYSPKAG